MWTWWIARGEFRQFGADAQRSTPLPPTTLMLHARKEPFPENSHCFFFFFFIYRPGRFRKQMTSLNKCSGFKVIAEDHLEAVLLLLFVFDFHPVGGWSLQNSSKSEQRKPQFSCSPTIHSIGVVMCSQLIWSACVWVSVLFFFLQVEALLFILKSHPRVEKLKKESRTTFGIFFSCRNNNNNNLRTDVLRPPVEESHCSHNNIQDVGKHGAFRGLYLSSFRLSLNN